MINLLCSLIGVGMWLSGALFWGANTTFGVTIYMLLSLLIAWRYEYNSKNKR